MRLLDALGLMRGRWLDYGCAEGGYTAWLATHGVEAVGVDVEPSRVAKAQAHVREDLALNFLTVGPSGLPFADSSFDVVLLNEVLEHVADERETLSEVRRVLRPGGSLALFSPNRFFPFEGHGLQLTERRTLDVPVPIVPWLPAAMTRPFVRGRNYWPSELRDLVVQEGFTVTTLRTAFPQFEQYRWLPEGIADRYRHSLPRWENAPIIRKFGVSVLVIASKPYG